MSGTPLSVLDPKGSPTIEQTYEKMEKNLHVRETGDGSPRCLTWRLGWRPFLPTFESLPCTIGGAQDPEQASDSG